MTRKTRRTAIVLSVAVLALAACGSDKKSGGSVAPADSSAPTASDAPTPTDAPSNVTTAPGGTTGGTEAPPSTEGTKVSPGSGTLRARIGAEPDGLDPHKNY